MRVKERASTMLGISAFADGTTRPCSQHSRLVMGQRFTSRDIGLLTSFTAM